MRVMTKRILVIFFIILSSYSFGQVTMIPISALIEGNGQGYEKLQVLIRNATNHVEVLPSNDSAASDVLYKTQVSAGSALGSVIYNTGGILVDSGWIRILGSGNVKLKRSIMDWNLGKSIGTIGEKPTFFLVADDAIGGFFAINGGALGNDLGNVYYLAPDDLTWFPMEIPYSQFLEFCLSGDIETFYTDNKWKSWKQDVSKLTSNQVISFYPPLWSKEGSDINRSKKTTMDVEAFYNETLQTLEILTKAKKGK